VLYCKLMKAVVNNQLRLIVEPHKWHWAWKETMERLDVLTKRVNECKDIQAASEFARWLRMSGLLAMFHDNPQRPPLEVDGAKMETALRHLLALCADQWKRGAVGVIEVSELQKLNHKLDLLAHRVASGTMPRVLEQQQLPSASGFSNVSPDEKERAQG